MPYKDIAIIKKTSPPSTGTQTGQQAGLEPPPGGGGGAKLAFATRINKTVKIIFEDVFISLKF